jgi:hypothetical protein
MYGPGPLDMGDFVLWRSDDDGTTTAELAAFINRWWTATAETAPFVYPKLRALAERWRDHPEYHGVEPKI